MDSGSLEWRGENRQGSHDEWVPCESEYRKQLKKRSFKHRMVEGRRRGAGGDRTLDSDGLRVAGDWCRDGDGDGGRFEDEEDEEG